MDDFTRKLLERTQARRETLNAKLARLPQPLPRKRRSPLKDENTGAAAILGAVIDRASDDDSPGKRQCLELEREDDKASKENRSATSGSSETVIDGEPLPRSKGIDVPEPVPNVRGRAVRLAALAANINNWEDDLPESSGAQLQQPPTPKPRPACESGSTPPFSSGSSMSSSQSRKTPSSSDQVSSANSGKKSAAKLMSPSVVTPKLQLPAVDVVQKASSSSTTAPIICLPSSIKQVVQKQHLQHTTPKKVVWDRAIVATLEAQGFVQSPSKSKLEYNFEQKSKASSQMAREGREFSDEEDDDVGVQSIKSGKPAPSSTEKARSVKDLAKKFDSPATTLDPSSSCSQKDPTELPLSARVALFEKNIGDALIPFPNRKSPSTIVVMPHSVIGPTSVKSLDSVPEPAVSSMSNVGKHTFELHKRLFEKVDSDWKSNEIATKMSEARQKDMAVVMNRWSYSKKVLEEAEVTSGKSEKAAYMPLSGKQDEDHQDDGKRRPSQIIPKPPPLPNSGLLPKVAMMTSRQSIDPAREDQEEEADETDQDRSSLEGSSEDEGQQESSEEPEEEQGFEESDHGGGSYDNEQTGCDSPDELSRNNSTDQDDAEQDQHLDSSILQVAFKRIQETKTDPDQRPQSSFPIQANSTVDPFVPEYNFRSPLSEPSVEAPLLHTVSFYRRQKEVNKTPVKTVTRNVEDAHSPPTPDYEEYKRFNFISEEESRAQILDKIKELQEDANAQLIIMSQASQALNLCRSTAEFHGSAEQIEGERLLLISFQRRQGCLNEMQRLKTDGTLGSLALHPARKGSLTIGEMRLTLKREFLAQTDGGKSGEFVHYFVCLVKHRGVVVATQMVNTMDGISTGAFHLANLINLRDLDHDFNILFEVYGLQTKRENINKDRKTLASRKDKSKSNLTPKKKLSKRDSKLASPGIQSPGGPSAICSTSFSLIGFSMINIKSMKRTNWTLEKVPFVSPLDGNLHMKVQCHTDHRVDEQGFLTMFEDVSGFGAWHRRWFHLNHRYISYWKYPDDVKRKEPIGQIDLCQCVTSVVSLVPRDICARPHTLMLLTVRPPSKDDVDTLVSQNYNTYTATKVLLSADTKEERIQWCRRFNDSLENLRMWNPNALRPIPSSST